MELALSEDALVVDSTPASVAVEATGIKKHYGGVIALDGVDIRIHQGEIFGIIGPNGAGKSTLFDVLCGIVQPTSGDVHLLGLPTKGLKPHQIARLGVARSFQRTAVFGEATAIENLLYARHGQSSHSVLGRMIHSAAWKSDMRSFEEKAEGILRLTKLQSERDRKASLLAYGVQRRLAVGIALMTEPTVLFLDEPAAGMNDEESAEFVELIRLVAPGRTVVLVEHDMTVIQALCHRCLVMVDGKPLVQGVPSEVLRRPEVVTAYLGADDE